MRECCGGKPRRAMKVKRRERRAPGPAAQRRPTAIPREQGLSWSADAGTRKMVNYACSGRSQGKPWWRTEGIVTCKSILRNGYRGERLIEPSGSWFPPKYHS